MSLADVEAAKREAADSGGMPGFWRNIASSEYWVLYLSIIYFLVLWLVTPGLASRNNISNIFSNMLPLVVVAIGQTVVLITGGIDLSVTSIIALASVVGASVMTSDGGLFGATPLAAFAGVLLMLSTGLLIGFINGACITRFNMPPFIVTLTLMMFFSGVAIWLTESRSIYNLPVGFTMIAKGSLLFVPYALIVAGGLAIVAHLLLSRTLIGRRFYAVGINPKAATVSGVPVGRTLMLAYLFSGLCAALASVLYTGRLETGSPVLGQRILLDVIGAAVIGGTSLFGGKGRVTGTVYGVLFITLVDNSLNMLGLSYFIIMMVKGLVILCAALLDAARTRYLLR